MNWPHDQVVRNARGVRGRDDGSSGWVIRNTVIENACHICDTFSLTLPRY